MEIMINERPIISNIEIRWYLSSVWIGKEKNYYEIEMLKNTSYGSFNWLWSDVDTILFDKQFGFYLCSYKLERANNSKKR